MAVVELSGVPVVDARVTIPLTGAWVADLQLQGTTPPVVGQRVTLTIGAVPFVGTVATSESDRGRRVTCRVVGGANGLGVVVPSGSYYQATVREIVSSVLGIGGEALSPLADASVLDVLRGHWTRVAGTVGDVVKAALRGSNYRMTPDGLLWVGSDTWLPVSGSFTVDSEEPAAQRMTLGLESAVVLPGFTVDGKRASEVVYTADASKLRAIVSYGSNAEGLLPSINRLIDRRMKAADLHAIYVATVVTQHADGTCDLKVTDERIGNPARVPVRIAGVDTIRFLPFADVLLAHEDGREDRPYVCGAYQGPVQKVSTTAVESVAFVAPRVEVGGQLDLVLHTPLMIWVAALTTAAAPLGLTVPALAAANTTITKGA